MNKRTLMGAAAIGALRPGMMTAPRMERSETSLADIQALVEDANKAVAALRAENDKRISALEKGRGDAITDEHVERINKDVGKLSDEVDKIIADRKADQAWKDSLEKQMGRQGLTPAGAGSSSAQAAAMSAIITARCGTQTVITAEQFEEYSNAVDTLIRKGPDRVNEQVRNALSVGSDKDGGYLVGADRQARILKRLFDTSPVRQYASVLTTSADKIEFPIDVEDATTGGWVSEQGSRSETATPGLGLHVIELHEQYAEPHVTQKLLEDAGFSVEAWLEGKIADKFRRVENAAFVNGNGVGKPRGFMSYAADATTDADGGRAWGVVQYMATGTSGAFGAGGADKLIDMTMALKSEYHPGAIFAGARTTLAAVRKLKNGVGDYIWALGNLATGQPSTLLGYSAVAFDDMSAIGANSFSLAFANFGEAYVVADRLGMTILRDPYTGKPKVKFYSRKRVGGDVVNSDAIKYLKFGAS